LKKRYFFFDTMKVCTWNRY